MAILQIEDLSGSCEAVVFPKSYERLSDHIMTEVRLLIWASVDRRDDRIQLIVDDCRVIDDVRLLIIEMLPEQATDITFHHRLRECLHKQSPEKNEYGIRVPVVASLRQDNDVRYIRFGHQFCVRNVHEAVKSLNESSFRASSSESLLAQ